jgi:hypothetical protein
MKKMFAILALATVFIYGCQKDENLVNDDLADETTSSTEGEVVLGEKLENPYSVKNMKKALKALNENNLLKSVATDDGIEATDLYVRFLPSTEEELDQLKEDTTLELFDYPLDYEIEEGGEYYHDPSLPDTAITWQYTSVPVNFQFPDIEYEILDSLYLYDEDDNSTKSVSVSYFDWVKLEDKAFEITGNLEEDSDTTLSEKSSKWRPSGTITANGMPVVGCKVRARRLLKVKTTYTDNNGDFSTGSFRHTVNYSIKWERGDFDIRSGTWGQAYYNGPKRHSAWILNITGGASLRYAFIHQAAVDYFYRNPFGTSSPLESKWYRSNLKIAYYDKDGDVNGDWAKWRNWFTWPHIRIYKSNDGVERTTTEIYATTIHEMAHSAHFQKIVKASGSNRISDFINAETKLKESWAVGMQTLFTRYFIDSSYDRYRNVSTYHRTGNYTEIVLELIEKAGYSAKELESCLPKASTMNEWEENINDKCDKDEEILYDIFDSYE